MVRRMRRDDPVLVVPWSDPNDSTGNRRFIDLRENPYDLDHLPEAEHYPPLMHALRALNAAGPRSLRRSVMRGRLTPRNSTRCALNWI